MWPGAPEGLVTFNEGGGNTEGLVQEDRKFSHLWGFVVEGRIWYMFGNLYVWTYVFRTSVKDRCFTPFFKMYCSCGGVDDVQVVFHAIIRVCAQNTPGAHDLGTTRKTMVIG